MFKKLTGSLIVFMSAIIVVSAVTPSFAQCNPPQNVFEKIQDSFPRNIRETAVNHLTSAVMDWTFNVAAGAEMSEYMGCSTFMANQMNEPEMSSLRDMLAEGNCDITDETTCQNLLNQWSAGVEGASRYDHKRFAQGKVAGSFVGIGYAMHNTMMYEPAPVNTAYFFKDYAYRLPIIGDRVLAADNEVDYRHSFINTVLGIWKITRNAAYAFMALIMLYVGITIILRKQISQKVVVTVQYSLPKIALALIFIAFSYPIGALMTSLAWSLFYSAPQIIQTLGDAAGAGNIATANGIFRSVGWTIVTILTFVMMQFGVSIGLISLIVILVVILAVLYVFAMFKALKIFLQMLIGIVSAPIEFAISAIPGNEDKLYEWFKRMGTYCLSIFGISATIELVHLFGATAIANSSTDNPLGGIMFAVFGYVFIYIFGYTFALRVPDHIETFIMGKKKGGR